MARGTYFVISVAALFFALIFFLYRPLWLEQQNTTLLDQQTLPALYVYDSENNRVALNSNKAQAIFLWATWCDPCLRELPMLWDLQQGWKEKGLDFVFVNYDYGGFEKSKAKAQEWLDENKISITSLYDPSQQVIKQLQITGLPAAMGVQEGQLHWLEIGERDWKRVDLQRRFFESLLTEE